MTSICFKSVRSHQAFARERFRITHFHTIRLFKLRPRVDITIYQIACDHVLSNQNLNKNQLKSKKLINNCKIRSLREPLYHCSNWIINTAFM